MASDEIPWIRLAGQEVDGAPSGIRQHVDKLADEQRVQDLRVAALRAELGFAVVESDASTVTAIRGPLSGHTLRWRHDGYYQSFGVTDHVDEDAWTPWGYDLDGYQHFQEVSPGDSDAPTWWLCTGEARPTAKISAWLADNRDVPTLRLGSLWLAEYVHTPIALFIDIDADLITHYPYRSAVEPPAKFPYNGYARNPRSPR